MTPIVLTAAILENPRLSYLHGQAKPSFLFATEMKSRRSTTGCAFDKGDQISHSIPFQHYVSPP
jgi:hypothetical protein